MRIFRGVAKAGLSDSELLAAHASGDAGAFPELLSRHYDHLWHVARRTSYTVEDAADALQEALLSVHRTAGSFRKDAAVRSWLHTIVVNACLDRIRRNRVRPTVSLSSDEAVDPRDVRDYVAEREVTLLVDQALLRLPVEQRAAIVAVDMEGYSVAEAARRLGVPEGTIKSRCARARSKLASHLEYLREVGNRS
ncbi:RNA polymerase sigma factor SigM [Rhodococcus spongiicola]|uniref:RNA polymerase sigma factor SigM n=1 Tax=Rhodococcus spongiicola TaxID=2487352 RepID=A0A3S3B3N1_9NOCA|nr:RNA polymerase sigma factor SigM [Rhodococcus spongiicola]RVW02351.1 RNA polymerase sigma factor SigM [Rhodococcus spongiicola]